MPNPRSSLPSKRLFYFSIPVILGLAIFVLIQNGQVTVVNSNNQNQITSTVDSTNSTQTGSIQNSDNFSNSSTTNNVDNTFTGKVALQLFTDSLSLQQGGVDPTNIAQSLSDNVTNGILSNSPTDAYKDSDLKIIPAPSGITALLSFANNFLIISNQANKQFATLNAVSSMSDPASPEFSNTMSTLSKIYSSLAKRLVSVSVPQELEKSYLLLINTFARSGQDYASAATEKTDPLLAVVAIGNIKNDITEQQSITKAMNNYLVSQSIVFSNQLNVYTIKKP